jgi:hypothetical protein
MRKECPEVHFHNIDGGKLKPPGEYFDEVTNMMLLKLHEARYTLTLKFRIR